MKISHAFIIAVIANLVAEVIFRYGHDWLERRQRSGAAVIG